MKILFLAHRTPYPPDKGDKIRSFHLLSHLAQKHDVALVYFVDDPRDQAHAANLNSLCKGKAIAVRLHRWWGKCRALWSLLIGRSFTEGFYDSRAFRLAVDNLVGTGPFDAVFAFSSGVAPYAARISAHSKIVDFVDVDSDKWGQMAKSSRFALSWLYRLEQKRLSRLETAVSAWAGYSLFVSQTEVDLFRAQGGRGTIEVLPNGTELELRRLPRDPIATLSNGLNENSARSVKIIFVGTMDYYPNVDAVQYFAQEIFPRIREKFPLAVFQIVGRSPAPAVRRLGTIDGVQVVGEVSDVRAYLVGADVSVAPMRIARGVPNKVLEAMGMGIPVVATTAAIRGIDVVGGEEILIGNSSEEFAAQVVTLLSDHQVRRAVTKRAWKKMQRAYNWEAIGARLEILLHPGMPANRSGSEVGDKVSNGQK
jgi:sugar transferase (PEP-CTERM/EpsH1 system associated)